MNLIDQLKSGSEDVNNHDQFFSNLTKALLLHLSQAVRVGKKGVPHRIQHTGDDTLWLELKEYSYSNSILDQSNEAYTYDTLPRCIVQPGSISVLRDQMTQPYARGQFVWDSGEEVKTCSAEMLRLPITMAYVLRYHTDTYKEAIELVQQVLTKMGTTQVFKFVYLGQVLPAEFVVSSEYSIEILTDMDGTTNDPKYRTIEVNIDVSSNLPIYDEMTIADASKVITTPVLNIKQGKTKIN